MTDHRHDPGPGLLLPDDAEVYRLLLQAEELLKMVRTSEEISAEEDDEPWTLPGPIAGGTAAAAIDRITDAIWVHVTPPDQDNPSSPRMYGPLQYEHMPFRLIAVPTADVDTLVAAVQVCRRALEGGLDHGDPEHWRLADLRALLEDVDLDPTPWGGQAPIHGREKVDVLDRVTALLTLAPDDDTRTLSEIVTAANGRDVVLTEDQVNAYQRVVGRFNQLLTSAEPEDQPGRPRP